MAIFERSTKEQRAFRLFGGSLTIGFVIYITLLINGAVSLSHFTNGGQYRGRLLGFDLFRLGSIKTHDGTSASVIILGGTGWYLLIVIGIASILAMSAWLADRRKL